MTSIVCVNGRVLPLRGANIDTDRIIPARFLRTVSFEGLEQHVFEDDRAAATARGEVHPFDELRFEGASVLAVNANFGCGSSREHAPQAIYRRGIRAIIGESFAEIFFGNAVMLGMPCVTASPEDVRRVQDLAEASPATVVAVDLASGVCEIGDAGGTRSRFAIHMPPSARDALVSGAWDATGLLLAEPAAIDRVAAALPYISGF
jgi:3-isopropylmalate/(R)-2-methylmalate dehydratase small subunit